MVVPGKKTLQFFEVILVVLTIHTGLIAAKEILVDDVSSNALDNSLDLTKEQSLYDDRFLDQYSKEELQNILKSVLKSLVEKNQFQNDDVTTEEKRMSSSKFYGARGKKEVPVANAFYGSRGKKSDAIPNVSGFYGARGRKRRSTFYNRFARSDNGIFYGNGKRIDPDTFFGMRGKRTQEEYNPLVLKQGQYYKTIPSQEMQIPYEDYNTGPHSSNTYYSEIRNDEENALSGLDELVPDFDNYTEEEMGKERLKTLLSYYNSLRNRRFQSLPQQDNMKVKRQPPSGFHAIRGR